MALPPPIKIYNAHSCITNPGFISPYFSNIKASYLLLKKDVPPSLIKDYMAWYMENLNYPDIYGLSGTIYDFLVLDDNLIPTNSYDSVDAYSATFLILAYFYAVYTKDYNFIKDNIQQLKDIAYNIVYLKDNTDGLTKALPYRDVKYLIDNLEAYVGLRLFSQLLKNLSDRDWKYYMEHAKEVKRGINEHFYSQGKVYWAIENGVKHPIVGDKAYPDRLAKLYWMVFRGKKVYKDIGFLTCEQKVAIKVFYSALRHINLP